MTLQLHELHAFRAITEHGSVGRVAEALGLTQPALTPRRSAGEQVTTGCPPSQLKEQK